MKRKFKQLRVKYKKEKIQFQQFNSNIFEINQIKPLVLRSSFSFLNSPEDIPH
jgi:hypothetical protein